MTLLFEGTGSKLISTRIWNAKCTGCNNAYSISAPYCWRNLVLLSRTHRKCAFLTNPPNTVSWQYPWVTLRYHIHVSLCRIPGNVKIEISFMYQAKMRKPIIWWTICPSIQTSGVEILLWTDISWVSHYRNSYLIKILLL